MKQIFLKLTHGVVLITTEEHSQSGKTHFEICHGSIYWPVTQEMQPVTYCGFANHLIESITEIENV